MKVLVLSNPISGSGRAKMAAEQCAQQLKAADHEVRTADTRPCSHFTADWLDPELSDADLLVISGGDGAVRLASESACRTRVPIYHLPFGTENLFAREFNMDRSIETLLAAIENWNIRTIDIGRANGEAFLLMASVGFDADVVHTLAQCRGSSISHWTYVAPIISQLRRWRPPLLNVVIDGECIVRDRPGFVVVGNSRQYGWRLNPAGRASMSDGVLDVAFFPARWRGALFFWALKCRRQSHLSHPGLIYKLAKQVEIRCAHACRFQLDGDPPGTQRKWQNICMSPLSLSVEIVPSALRVLSPLQD